MEHAYLQADRPVLSAADMTRFSGHVITNTGYIKRSNEEHEIVLYSVAAFGTASYYKRLN